MDATTRSAIDGWVELWNDGNVTMLDSRVSTDAVMHIQNGGPDFRGRSQIGKFVKTSRSAFPDLHFAVEDEIASGDRVVHRWVLTGTRTGEWQGMSPTGGKVRLDGASIMRVADGKVVEQWSFSDSASMLSQLGKADS